MPIMLQDLPHPQLKNSDYKFSIGVQLVILLSVNEMSSFKIGYAFGQANTYYILNNNNGG